MVEKEKFLKKLVRNWNWFLWTGAGWIKVWLFRIIQYPQIHNMIIQNHSVLSNTQCDYSESFRILKYTIWLFRIIQYPQILRIIQDPPIHNLIIQNHSVPSNTFLNDKKLHHFENQQKTIGINQIFLNKKIIKNWTNLNYMSKF